MDNLTYTYLNIAGAPSNRLGHVDEPRETINFSGASGTQDDETKGSGNSYTTEFVQYSLSRNRFPSDTFLSRKKIIFGNPMNDFMGFVNASRL
jgi:hypothetical protein